MIISNVESDFGKYLFLEGFEILIVVGNYREALLGHGPPYILKNILRNIPVVENIHEDILLHKYEDFLLNVTHTLVEMRKEEFLIGMSEFSSSRNEDQGRNQE